MLVTFPRASYVYVVCRFRASVVLKTRLLTGCRTYEIVCCSGFPTARASLSTYPSELKVTCRRFPRGSVTLVCVTLPLLSRVYENWNVVLSAWVCFLTRLFASY